MEKYGRSAILLQTNIMVAKLSNSRAILLLLLSLTFSLVLLVLSSSDHHYSSSIPGSFIYCLSRELTSNVSILNALYFPGNSSYESILESRIENLRFLNHSGFARKKPLAIITPESYSHVQTTIKCCRQNGLRVRIRSGGHDYEGTSYTTSDNVVPFIMVDLRNLRSISVDLEDNSAWVESGATIGELYYAIAEKSPVHGFPAGLYSTVGVGGHFSGGGVGNLVRKHGLAADNVIDANIIDANGRILDKRSMGSDLFWAIRGGGGASFGVIVAWKIRLVQVSPIVTVFELSRSLERGAIDLIHKWQDIGHKVHRDLLISVVLSAGGGGTQTLATFRSLFQGRADDLLAMMEEIFPEIGLRKEDCDEMSWIESIVRFSSFQRGETIEALKNGVAPLPVSFFKGKVDLVYKPIPYEALEELWKRCSDHDDGVNTTPPIIHFEFHPYGGRMNEIPESETPFPHRKGVLCEILYIVAWVEEENGESYMNWLRGLYEFMSPFVSKGPRGAIVNVRDFDLGTNDIVSGTSYSEAKVWGSRYFKNNFQTLALVKGEVDHENFFYHEQSIPPLVLHPQRKLDKYGKYELH